MRVLALGLLVLLLAAGEAVASGLAPLGFNTALHFEFVSCAVGGSASQNIPEGPYLVRVTGADSYLCFAASCATGGEILPVGAMLLLSVPRGSSGGGLSMSCRSGGTGTITMTGAY